MRRQGREVEGSGPRHERTQSLVLDELRTLMRDDVSDPVLDAVRVTAVVLSIDHRNARVHFALASEEQPREVVERALLRATAFLRARLAEAIDMKRTPELRFVFEGTALPDEDAANRP